MKSYLDLCRYNITVDDMEEIIKAVTIFGDDKKLLRTEELSEAERILKYLELMSEYCKAFCFFGSDC